MLGTRKKPNDLCPNCKGNFFNRFTGKCRSCSARAAKTRGKSTVNVDKTPQIKREKEKLAMRGVNYENEIDHKMRDDIREKKSAYHPIVGAIQ